METSKYENFSSLSLQRVISHSGKFRCGADALLLIIAAPSGTFRFQGTMGKKRKILVLNCLIQKIHLPNFCSLPIDQTSMAPTYPQRGLGNVGEENQLLGVSHRHRRILCWIKQIYLKCRTGINGRTFIWTMHPVFGNIKLPLRNEAKIERYIWE